MIKVSLLEEGDKRVLFFEASRPEEQDELDKVLEALAGEFPRRGAYVLGAPNLTLKIEVKIDKK